MHCQHWVFDLAVIVSIESYIIPWRRSSINISPCIHLRQPAVDDGTWNTKTLKVSLFSIRKAVKVIDILNKWSACAAL